MRLTVAVFVQVEREEGRAIYHCRPLRGPQLSSRDPLLSHALHKLGNSMRSSINGWIERGEVRRLSTWLYTSDMRSLSIKLTLALRDRTLRWKLHMVCLPAFSRLVAFSPSIPEVSFEIEALSELEARASEVYARWAQTQLSEGHEELLPGIGGGGDSWIEPLELEAETTVKPRQKSRQVLAALFGGQRVSGSEELHKVGQCLDEIASEFGPALGRGPLVDEVDRLMQRADRQGVLLVGPSAVGKTAIVQECVSRRVARYHDRTHHKPQVWWLSPQRLVSGMSYLGQWEQRWLAILREGAKRDHIFYFDDLIGLFTAGRTRDSSLCAADVLRSFLSEHPLRILAETTAEQLAVLRRRDRALADRFHLVRVPTLSAQAALPITLEAVYELEIRAERFFHPEVVPLVVRQQESFAPDQAFPGKAIAVCKTLTKHVESVVDQRSVLELAGAQWGTNVGLLLGGLGDQATIQRVLSRQIIGQPAAVEALSRTVIRYAQHLQASDRPLGVLLLLGPTGVGKTEAAKALTRLLYTDDSQLVRLDMNELTTSLAAEQLVGTFDQPEGRLTAAVRRQPNCVILLDEIEKAHPDVFDYLLQVLGEGRLTDARGRIADFRSAVIIMTSNLGAHEQTSNLGFEITPERRQQIYRKAAEQFFRPEFFNRIDEVVPFRSLAREDMEQIVALQLSDVLRRDGIQRREAYVKVDRSALNQVIQRGYAPLLGARAVKRMLESDIVSPVADCLAGMALSQPALVHVTQSAAAPGLACEVIPLAVAPCQPPRACAAGEQLVERATACYARLENRLNQLQPELQQLDRQQAGQSHAASYYALREHLFRCSEGLKSLKQALRGGALPPMGAGSVSPSPSRRELPLGLRRHIRDWHAQDDLRSALSEQPPGNSPITARQAAAQLIDQLKIAGLMLDAALAPRSWLVGLVALTQDSSSDDLELEPLLPTGTIFEPAASHWWYAKSPVARGLARLMHCLQHGWQYDVYQPWLPGGFHLVAGVSLIGILRPLLGTYRVELKEPARPAASHLFSLRALAIPSDMPAAQVPSLLQSHNSLNDTSWHFSPPEQPWPTTVIRGCIGDSWSDYPSQATLNLMSPAWMADQRLADDALQWWIDCLPLQPELCEG